MNPRTAKLRLEFKNRIHWEENCNNEDFLDLITKRKKKQKLQALCEIQEVKGKIEVIVKYQDSTTVYKSAVIRFCKQYRVKLLHPAKWNYFSEEETLILEKVPPVEEEAKLRESENCEFPSHQDLDFRDAPSTNASTDNELREDIELLKKDKETLRSELENVKSVNQSLQMEMKNINEAMKIMTQKYYSFLEEKKSLQDSKRILTNSLSYYEYLLKKNHIDPLQHMDEYFQETGSGSNLV
jgi:hypothetical protein